MLPNHRSDEEQKLAKRFQLYSLFAQYYQGDWRQAGRIINVTRQYLRERGEELADGTNGDWTPQQTGAGDAAVEFDYNRLFLGPARLLAPPVESAYRNAQGLVMQAETLAVRDFYRQAGLAVQGKNAVPDDHLGLELEFVCYLLARAGQNLTSSPATANRYVASYQDFYEKHLQQWVYRHCQDVKAKARTPACRGAAAALTGFLQSEEREFAARREQSETAKLDNPS